MVPNLPGVVFGPEATPKSSKPHMNTRWLPRGIIELQVALVTRQEILQEHVRDKACLQ